MRGGGGWNGPTLKEGGHPWFSHITNAVEDLLMQSFTK